MVLKLILGVIVIEEYRLEFSAGGLVKVDTFESGGSCESGFGVPCNTIMEAEDLPAWAKRKLAILNMLPSKPPTAETVRGVGRRISLAVFWIQRETNEDRINGYDTRKESKK